MQAQFTPGDLVCNKAKQSVPYTFSNAASEDASMAVCYDADSNKHLIPFVALMKYIPPTGSTVRDISNLW